MPVGLMSYVQHADKKIKSEEQNINMLLFIKNWVVKKNGHNVVTDFAKVVCHKIMIYILRICDIYVHVRVLKFIILLLITTILN